MGAAVDWSVDRWDRNMQMDRQWVCGVYSQLEWFSKAQNGLVRLLRLTFIVVLFSIFCCGF
jgi:hypothetical protein